MDEPKIAPADWAGFDVQDSLPNRAEAPPVPIAPLQGPGSEGAPSPFHVWQQFSERHAGNPALEKEALYALPPRLIELIRADVPDFFSAEEERFEHELAECSGAGFFRQRRLIYPPLAHRDALSQRLNAERQRQVDEHFADLMRRYGRTDVWIQQYREREASFQLLAAERQRGYLGWLATNPDFCRDREAFRKEWFLRLCISDEMPSIPKVHFGIEEEEGDSSRDRRSLPDDHLRFYRHWALETMATWDLPIPLESQLMGHGRYDDGSLTEAGLTLFIPWHLLADKNLRLDDLAAHHRSFGHVPHLDGWLQGTRTSGLGWRQFGVLFELYVYLELALRGRYGRGLRRKTQRLDQPFSRFIYEKARGDETSAESIRKLRQEMDRNLREFRKSAEQATPGTES